IDVVTYAETSNLAHHGGKVIHPRAVEIAMQAEIPIRIRSTYLGDEEGNLITSSWAQERGIDVPDRSVTGIAYVDDLDQLIVSIDKDDLASQAKVIRVMEEKEISVNFINISASFIAFTIPMEVADEAEELLKSEGFHVEVTKDCAKVSAVGADMTGDPGVLATLTSTLIDND